MIGNFTFIFSFFAFAISFLIFREKYNPIIIFNFTWMLTIFLSLLNFNGIYSTSDTVYLYILLGLIVFNFVSYLFFNFPIITSHRKNRGNWYIEKKYRFFLVLQLVLLIYHIIKSYTLINILKNGMSFNLIRNYYFSNQFLSSTIEYLLLIYVINPLIVASEIILCIEIQNRNSKRFLNLIMLVNILLRTFISGGRMIFVEIAIIIFTILIINKKINLTRKMKKRIYRLAIVSISLAILISTFRGSEGNIISIVLDRFIVNFAGSFAYLSKLLSLNEIDLASLYGRATFGGFLDLFISFLRFIGFTTLETAATYIGRITSKFVYIGNYSYNAMPTMYYYFLLDFGMFGIFLGTSILSLISVITYKYYLFNRNERSLSIYLLVVLSLTESSMKWLFAFPEYIFSIIFLMLFYSKYKKNQIIADTIEEQ